MANVIEIRVRATDETGPVYDAAKTRAAEEGRNASAAYTSGFASHVRSAGGEDMASSISASLQDAIPQDTLGPDSSEGEKIRENAKKTGEQAGKEAGEGMSPMLVTALAGGLAVGAPLILGAFGGIMAGVTGLALKNNAVIKQDFADLGTTASATLSQAVAPAAGTLNQALVTMQGTVKGLEPQLQGLFVNAEPDITALASGVGSLASNILPGLSSALANSQGIVADLGQGLGSLGSGVGGMFQGLTRDAYTTGAGMESLLGTVGHLASTLGTVLGSAASAGGTALMGLDPILNTTLGLVQKIANPATVGAAGGLFAAMKFDPSIASGLTNAAGALSKYASGAVTAEGESTKLGSAASGMAGALGKGASVMSGPWGMAIGAGIGLVTGLVGSLINASHASDALTVSQQDLQNAISQDGGAAGQATAAYITATDAANGLSKTAADAGVSQATWTEAVLGNKDAQASVIAAVNTANQVIQNQQLATDEASRSSGKFSGELQDATISAQAGAAAHNTLTDANQKLINSLNAQTRQVADAISTQTKYQQAMAAVTNEQTLFNASLEASYNQLVANAQASALTTVGALNLGSANYTVTSSLSSTVTAYSEAQTEGNAYGQVLQAINGDAQTLIGSEASFTTALSGLTDAVKVNGTSLDVNTKNGAANITAFTGIASAADKAATAVYQNEVNTKGATTAYNDANAKLAQEKQAFEDAAIKAGYNKDQVKALADQLFQLPPDVKIGVDTSAATSGLTTLIKKINNSSGTVKIYESSSGQVWSTGGGNKAEATGGAYGGAAATGGIRSNLVMVGERGTELVRMPFGSTVIPHSNLESMAATGNLGASGGGGSAGGGFEISFSGNTDGAFATAFMMLVRTGKIQIKKKAIVP